MPSRQSSARAANHAHGSDALRPAHDVEQAARRRRRRSRSTSLGAPRPCRTNSVSSSPSAVDVADPVGVVVEQRGAVGDHGVVDGVPVTAELDGDLVDGAAVAGRPARSPTARPGPSAPAGAPRSGVLIGPRARPDTPTLGHRQRCLRHTSRAGRPKHGRSTSSTGGRSFTATAPPQPAHDRPSAASLDVRPRAAHRPRSTTPSTSRGQANQQLAHARRVHLHRGSPELDGVEPSNSQGPCYVPGMPHTPLISEAPKSSTHVVHACSPPPGNSASIPERSR